MNRKFGALNQHFQAQPVWLVYTCQGLRGAQGVRRNTLSAFIPKSLARKQRWPGAGQATQLGTDPRLLMCHPYYRHSRGRSRCRQQHGHWCGPGHPPSSLLWRTKRALATQHCPLPWPSADQQKMPCCCPTTLFCVLRGKLCPHPSLGFQGCSLGLFGGGMRAFP